jgi:hypothetical protein
VNGIENISQNECRTDLIDAPVTKNTLSSVGKAESEYAIGVRGNIYEYSLFPKDSIDLVVSTNTLIENQLDPTRYSGIIDSFCKYTSEDGELIFNTERKNINKKMMRDLNRRFDHIEVINYSNRLSNAWESYLENNEGEIKMSNGVFFIYNILYLLFSI